ncbi:glutathione S-transferase family protein [Myxococcus sp. MISCRS1]|uniref:glutathione S-transferase family protein n=1 Tax=Myxococcus TaxID=32 RepID=UPI001141C2EB|nr:MULTISPECIES: glutathione S-transferase family protein [unclassified Myxococcus]MBZ4395670.1 glutathione S-transferase family protein [Myxococcus sp. AS-1-15]MBZ4411283.1 glutathione S-transferase family protein [Myxococcus sp. XM-1-1-1]MCY0998972.1 glutathione S-transferase family protein [Myxococcus sp. MISCRS1]BDT31026.1 glutathione S-transferase family protein [Myxococcus sp. MH1]
MMKLYFARNTRATRPRWLLEELGVPYELVPVDVLQREHKSPEYLRIHPMGSMPALEDDGQPIFESAAILLHVADKYLEQGFAPPLGSPERAEYYQWMFFCMSTMEPPLSAYSAHSRFLPEEQQVVGEAERGRRRFTDIARMLESRLQGRTFLVGERFTAADVVMTSILEWGGSMGLLEDFPGLRAYVERHLARPAARRALE